MREVWTDFRWGLSGERQQMIVEDGKVLARGVNLDAGESDAREVSFEGRWLLPAFNDAHCHILPTGLDLRKLHLGQCASREEVLDAVRDRLAELPVGEWLEAVHYDQTRFEDGVHLTRDALDAVSADVPIQLRHVNGHASVANSAALRAAGVDEATANPGGGTYVRDASGTLTGVLLERAHEHVSSAKPMPTLEEMVEAILAAGESMRALGITCASDMMTGQWDLDRELEAYRLASERGCAIRLRMYLQWRPVLGPRPIAPERLQEHRLAMDPARCRIAGLKIFADGAIGSATAAIHGRFLTSNGPGDTDGQLIYSPARLQKMVLAGDAAGYSVAIHTIGDRSTDLVMDAYSKVDDPPRHRIEHAMLLSDAQIERMASLGCHVTMQPEFLYRLQHAYLRQLGPERAARLERMRSALDAGVRLSLNSDRPIVAGDPWDGIRAATHRPPGFDPAEALTLIEAINAYTAGSADATDEIETLGQLEEGQWADYQVYEDDPLSVGPAPRRVACSMGGEEGTGF